MLVRANIVSGIAVVVLMGAVSSSRAAAAEVELPKQNPSAALSQQVGLTEIAVEYGSPAVRGRKIWGAAVPFDRPWSMAPGQPTHVRFSKEVQVGDRNLPAGTYTLYAIPAKTDWTVVFVKGVPSAAGDEKMDEVARLKVRPKAVPFRERLTFLFSDFTEEKTSLDFEWEKVRVSIPIAVNTSQQVLSGIADLENAWRSYANAARYMLETKKDYDAGLKYADQSLSLKEDWYTLWIKASLLAAKGDFRGARDSGEKAHALAQKIGDAFVLDYELRQNIAEWSKRAGDGKLTAR
jgi:hypothetical protein